MKTRYMIVEDEAVSARSLERMIAMMRPEYEAVYKAKSVSDASDYIKNGDIDLIFMDIELEDGNCFEIFRRTKTDVPVIFVTAYNEYALKAFKVNSVDYLLKPVETESLRKAIEKFETVHGGGARQPALDYGRLQAAIEGFKRFKRVTVSMGDTLMNIDTADIACFLSKDKYTYLYTFSGTEILMDKTLDNLEQNLDPEMFYRAARDCIVNIKAIRGVKRIINGRLRIELAIDTGKDSGIIVSHARRDRFLEWFSGGGK